MVAFLNVGQKFSGCKSFNNITPRVTCKVSWGTYQLLKTMLRSNSCMFVWIQSISVLGVILMWNTWTVILLSSKLSFLLLVLFTKLGLNHQAKILWNFSVVNLSLSHVKSWALFRFIFMIPQFFFIFYTWRSHSILCQGTCRGPCTKLHPWQLDRRKWCRSNHHSIYTLALLSDHQLMYPKL